MFKIDAFEIEVNILNGVTIKREEGSISYQPGEGANAINVMLHCMSVEQLKRLPPRIRHSPFEIAFDQYRVMELRREGQKERGVNFIFKEGDTLIEVLKQGMARHRDLVTIQGGVKGGFSSMGQPDPVIDGR